MKVSTPSFERINPDKAVALFVDSNGKPKNSYICACLGSGVSLLLEESLTALATKGHGALVDMVTFTSHKIKNDLKEALEKSGRNLFNLDLGEFEFDFTYNPFNGKNAEQCMEVALGILDIEKITNVGALHFANVAKMHIQAVLEMHFQIYNQLSFNDLIEYFCYAERIPKEVDKVKSFGDALKDFTPYIKWADRFYVENQFDYKLFIQNLGGFVGCLNMMRSKYQNLFDTANTQKPVFNIKNAILNQDIILLDILNWKSEKKCVSQFLKNMVAADIQVTLEDVFRSKSPDKVFTVLFSDASIISQKTRVALLANGRGSNIGLHHHFYSYDSFLEAPADYLQILDGNTHSKIVFREPPQENKVGLTVKQLDMKNHLASGQFLVINNLEKEEKVFKVF